ncbi:DsbA family protein [Azospirillum brasilense]|uniref:DsbA family protein n=1 Tax=Azospirillum brasilense TaxID=192 RepID=UPI00190D82FC|nr:DsbA family protein [Azospirillum brasilense]MBK3735257.1 DsbA family protein [Azospirillum brasilense]
MVEVRYLFDPLCGWCYGAAPMLDRLRADPGIDLTLMPTGLFAGDGARAMDPGFAAYAWANDQRIAALTGLPFTEAYRARVLTGAARFDSGPSTLALTAVRLTEPRREIDALKAIQRARYVDGVDTSVIEAVGAVLVAEGLREAAALLAGQDAALAEACRARIAAAAVEMQRFWLRGVPALLAGGGQTWRPIRSDALFGTPANLFEAIEPGRARRGV